MLKSRRVVIAVAAMVCIFCSSCAITRHIPEDKYLLKRVVITQDETTPKDEMIPISTLERYTRQSPNKRLFGTNFYLWMHYLANPDKSNWWNNLKRKIGEEPGYVDLNLTRRSQENLNVYMDSQGFYSSEATYKIDTMPRRRAVVQYRTQQGKPYIINDLKYNFRDTLLRPIIAPDTTNSLIQRGDIFSVALLDDERTRIATYLRNRGYFDFTVRNIEYRADTLAGNYTVDLEMIIKQQIDGYDERGNAKFKSNTQYRIGSIDVYSNYDPSLMIYDSVGYYTIDTMRYDGINIVYSGGERPNVRPKVLRQMVPLKSGDLYELRSVEQTYQNLMSLGYFKSARISFRPNSLESMDLDSMLSRRLVDLSPRDSLSNGSPVGYLSSHILCTPALKQSYEIELEGSTTSSFYGLYATLGYQNRNIFRGAESWNIDFTIGYEHMKARDVVKTKATEIGLSTGFTFPRFIFPFATGRFQNTVQPKTSVEVAVNLQDRPYYERTLSSASLDYSWRNKGYSSFVIRPIDINIIDMIYIDEDYFDELENEYLRNSYETQLVAGLSVGYSYNSQRKNANGNYTLLRVNAETAGNFVGAMQRLFDATPNSDGKYEIFGIQFAQYVRSDINVSRLLSIGRRSSIVGRLYAGAGWAYDNSTSIPFDRLFYSGGSNSMRGWTPRTLGPGSSDEQEDDLYPSQLGDMKLEANIEYRFPIWSKLYGATFFDAGNIWYIKDSEGVYDKSAIFNHRDFYKQLGFNTGVGLRFDIQFAVIRLDWGVQLHNPNKAEGERWVIKNFNFDNTSLNFGVGYPF